jgi:hypothetical protein
MMEGITGYLILALGFSLPCIGLVILFEKFRGWHPQPIHGQPDVVLSRTSSQKFGFFACFYRILVKGIPLLMKVNRDTVIKGLAAAGFILFTRKLIYYLPFDGVIQTKFSILEVEEKAQIFLLTPIFFFVGFVIIMRISERNIAEKKFGITMINAAIIVLFFVAALWFVSVSDSKIESITGRHLILIIFAPLVLLKMLFSGKYAGLLTGVLFGYLMVAGYKKLIPKISKRHVKIMIAAGLIFLIFLDLGFYHSYGNWPRPLIKKIESAESPGEIEELLDAVNMINNEDTKSNTLQRLAVAIGGTADTQWKQETFQRAIRITGAIESSNLRSKALKQIAVSIGKTGDFTWAKAIAEKIPDMEIRTSVLETIRQRIEKK